MPPMNKYIKLIYLNLSMFFIAITVFYGFELLYAKIDENREKSQLIQETLNALMNQDVIQPFLDSPLGTPLSVPFNKNKRGKKEKNQVRNTLNFSLEKHHVRLISLVEEKNKPARPYKTYICTLEAELDTDITDFLKEINKNHQGYIAIQEISLQRHKNIITSTVNLKSYMAPKVEEIAKQTNTLKNINTPENLFFTKKNSQTILKERHDRLLKSGACLQCTGFFYINENKWSAWVNGNKITATTGNLPKNLHIKKVTPEGLYVNWTSKNEIYDILLKNTERYDPYGRKIH